MSVPKAESTNAKKTYTGGCHCRSNIIEFHSFPLDSAQTQLHTCNCSHCQYNPAPSVLIPFPDLRFIAGGPENMVTYRFAKKEIEHFICKTCGIELLSRFERKKEFGFRVTVVDGFELTEEIQKRAQKHDGKSLNI
ncbi:hypothetical protein BT69DRAFT_1348792 [Atractiella rhizophila]|nr:hypothetical protein BT69DRAFT_1348792 [Atractiella rhizophila]